MDTLNKVISRNRATSYFLYAIATLFTGILSWGFIMSIQQGLSAKEAIVSMPTQLEVMWGAVMGMIFGGHEEEINKIEKALGIDLDKDGDVGLEGTPNALAVPDPVAGPVPAVDPGVAPAMPKEWAQQVTRPQFGPPA